MNAPGSIFVRRQNYAAFAKLPKHKINSYHIKMEDDGSHGNDEVRWFILSNLSASKVNKTVCIFCKQKLTIYDRYPLIEGTFFLSPIKHHSSAIPLNSTTSSLGSLPSSSTSPQCSSSTTAFGNCSYNACNLAKASPFSCSSNSSSSANSSSSTSPTTPTQANGSPHSASSNSIQLPPAQYINSICMSCLEGWSGQIICRFCGQRWDGCHLILGSIYMFDIFASEPCCTARISCNNCFAPLKFATQLSQQYKNQQQLQQFHIASSLSNTNSSSAGISCNNNTCTISNQNTKTNCSFVNKQTNNVNNNDFCLPSISATNNFVANQLGGNGVCLGTASSVSPLERQRSRSYTSGRLATFQNHFNENNNNNNNNFATVNQTNTNYNFNVNNNSPHCPSSKLLSKLHVFNFFSHYSRRYKCETCQAVDHHFVKPIETIFCVSS